MRSILVKFLVLMLSIGVAEQLRAEEPMSMAERLVEAISNRDAVALHAIAPNGSQRVVDRGVAVIADDQLFDILDGCVTTSIDDAELPYHAGYIRWRCPARKPSDEDPCRDIGFTTRIRVQGDARAILLGNLDQYSEARCGKPSIETLPVSPRPPAPQSPNSSGRVN